MFSALGRLVVRRTRLVLFGSVVIVVLTAVLGVGVFGRLVGGGFEDPGSESAQARTALEDTFDAGPANLVLIVTADGGDVDDAAVAAAAAALTARLAGTEDVTDVTSYWQLGSPPTLRSNDGSSALVFARITGDETTRQDTVDQVHEELAGEDGVVSVEVTGSTAVGAAIGERVERDLGLAEMIAIPLTLLLLIIVFRGVVAALLPLAVGTAAILGAFFVLWAISQFTDVSVFSINLVTALGLGLAIDYALLIVSRFREELDAGRSVDDATRRTVESAGRTVAFSGLTVTVALAALAIFPLYFLRSFAYAGVGVLLVAMAASVIMLPALLKLLGHRVNAWSLPGARTRTSESRFWGRVAERVLKRPGLVAVVVIAVLVVLGLPFLGVTLGQPDARVLPEGDPARVSIEKLQNDFPSDRAEAFPIVVTGTYVPADVDAYARQISAIDAVAEVDTARGTYVGGELAGPPGPQAQQYTGASGEWLEVVPDVLPMTGEAEDAIHEIRAMEAPFDAQVGGATASLVDTKSAIISLVPWAALWIAVATFVLLFLMFGSILVPIKALVLNTLSLTATLGAMVWIFQDGNLSGLLGFTPTGLTDSATPILIFTIAFGLSMDYEVFLLARIKEEYDRTGDNHQSIVTGLAKTGRIVTAAALVLSITFFAFATGGITFMKLFGLGLGLAVLVDAFVVRATLVPALMQLAGSANWWAPAWARRIHERFGLDESGPHDDPPVSDTPEDERVLVG